jgi:hypothetical protein
MCAPADQTNTLPDQTIASASDAVTQHRTATGSVLDAGRRVQVPLEEAAREYLGISYWLALRLAQSGDLPTNRFGSNRYVPIAVLRRAEQGLPLSGTTEGDEVA